jgi:hypothetical protein
MIASPRGDDCKPINLCGERASRLVVAHAFVKKMQNTAALKAAGGGIALRNEPPHTNRFVDAMELDLPTDFQIPEFIRG